MSSEVNGVRSADKLFVTGYGLLLIHEERRGVAMRQSSAPQSTLAEKFDPSPIIKNVPFQALGVSAGISLFS